MSITPPWPPKELAATSARAWSQGEDEKLRTLHGTMSIEDIAAALGRSKGSIRTRVTRLGAAKKAAWSKEELRVLKSEYENAGSGKLDLNVLAAKIGRSRAAVACMASTLGLTHKNRMKTDEPKVRVRKFATDAELRAYQSERQRKHIATNGHPRGMAGKSHTKETKARISKASKTYRLITPPEVLEANTQKAIKTRAKNGTGGSPRVARGSWKAGWREIGGKKNYYRSRWEANYARYLQWLKDMNQIRDWQHEPETFWFDAIRRGVRSYKPDFRVWENNGSSALHEVKGWMDSRSKTTLRRMAKYYPDETIVLIDGPQYRAIRRKVLGLIPDWEDSKRDSHA